MKQEDLWNFWKHLEDNGIPINKPITPENTATNEKAEKIFNLYNGATTDGERQAAREALQRIGYDVQIVAKLIRLEKK